MTTVSQASFNDPPEVQHQVAAGRVTWGKTFGMLVSRTFLFAAFQAGIALLLALSGAQHPWLASAAWWPFMATLTNLVVITLLAKFFKEEGGNFWSLFKFQRKTWKTDLLVVLGLLLIGGPLGFFPNFLAANVLFGNVQVPFELFARPLPLWAVTLGLFLFPITNALGELPNYAAYVEPRLEALSGSRWFATLIAAVFLAIQHCTLPLLFDWRFITWRLVMFLPFALFAIIVLRWRRRLLPYMVIVHGLMDFQLMLMVLQVSLS